MFIYLIFIYIFICLFRLGIYFKISVNFLHVNTCTLFIFSTVHITTIPQCAWCGSPWQQLIQHDSTLIFIFSLLSISYRPTSCLYHMIFFFRRLCDYDWLHVFTPYTLILILSWFTDGFRICPAPLCHGQSLWQSWLVRMNRPCRFLSLWYHRFGRLGRFDTDSGFSRSIGATPRMTDLWRLSHDFAFLVIPVLVIEIQIILLFWIAGSIFVWFGGGRGGRTIAAGEVAAETLRKWPLPAQCSQGCHGNSLTIVTGNFAPSSRSKCYNITANKTWCDRTPRSVTAPPVTPPVSPFSLHNCEMYECPYRHIGI